MDLLAEMAASSAARVARARAVEPLEALKERASRVPVAPPLRLGGFDLIAEVKLRAPSAGSLGNDDPARRARLYALAGAAAVSVLTEPLRFDGDLGHLASAAGCGVPRRRRSPFRRGSAAVTVSLGIRSWAASLGIRSWAAS